MEVDREISLPEIILNSNFVLTEGMKKKKSKKRLPKKQYTTALIVIGIVFIMGNLNSTYSIFW